jgi:hypothetical protein
MITGSGRVSLLSGQIRRYRVGLGLTDQIRLRYVVHAHEPLGRAGHARVGRRAGRVEESAQKLNSNKKIFFFFKTVL